MWPRGINVPVPHPSLAALRQAVARPAQPAEAPKRAAVAAIFTRNLDLVFIRRAEFPGDPWSGHIAFPGGQVEVRDPSPLHAAIRETEEEIGVDLRGAECLGPLDHVAPVSGLRPIAIEPFVFYVDAEPIFQPNAEVQSVHRVPLARLLHSEGRGRMPYHWQGRARQLPCIELDGLCLWGLTLRAVDDLLHRLDGRGMGLDRT